MCEVKGCYVKGGPKRYTDMSSVVSASSMRNTPTQFAHDGSEDAVGASAGGNGNISNGATERGKDSASDSQGGGGMQSQEDDTVVTTRLATGDAMSSSPGARATTKESESVRSQGGGADANANANTNEEPDFEYKFDAMNIVTLPTEKLIQMLTALLEKIVNSNDRLNTGSPTELLDDEEGSAKERDEDSALVSSIVSFKGKHVPQIGLEQYFHRIQKYCPTTNDVFLSLLIYFDRISKKCNSKLQEAAERASKLQDDNANAETEDKELLREGEKCMEALPPSDNSTQPYQTFVMDSYNIHRLIIAGITVSTKFFSDFFYSNSRYARVGGISLKEMNHLELQFLVLSDFELIISVEEMERYANLLYRFWNSDSEANASEP